MISRVDIHHLVQFAVIISIGIPPSLHLFCFPFRNIDAAYRFSHMQLDLAFVLDALLIEIQRNIMRRHSHPIRKVCAASSESCKP